MKEKEKTRKAEKRLGRTGAKKKSTETAGALCKDRDCPFHGKLRMRGRTFEGVVKRKFPRRITLEFERMTYIKKYERYAKSKTKIHARLPSCMEDEINIGDAVLVKECRPLSKIIHFVVIRKIKSGEKLK
jgi:small subunit ribosomal protein S17